MKKLFTCLAMMLAVTLALSADVYVKMKTHSDAMSIMGQTTPAQDGTTEQWIGDDKFASLGGDKSFIIDLKKNLGYIIDAKAKTYVETPLPLDMSKLLPPEAAAFAGMMKMSATVAPTTETKKIGSWTCTGYDVNLSMTMFAMKMKVWAATDVPFDANAFNAKIWANLVKGQMMMDDASIKEMAKIKGFQIATETTGDVMGAKMRSTTEVVEIAKKDAPVNVYSVPAGFTKTATLSMDAIQKR
ncbi:MAG: hypothetical protein Q8O91_04895 [Candidatus Aminicenantes bacterium]|nr:hypothetical protein [Candidatus Aminicenantes bacterium]